MMAVARRRAPARIQWRAKGDRLGPVNRTRRADDHDIPPSAPDVKPSILVEDDDRHVRVPAEPEIRTELDGHSAKHGARQLDRNPARRDDERRAAGRGELSAEGRD